MAKKKRITPRVGSGGNNGAQSAVITAEPQGSAKPGIPGTSASNGKTRTTARSLLSAMVPAEVERGDWTVAILAFMMFLTPAIGVPNEEMLQDTLKSIVASFAAVSAGLLFFWQQRNRREGLRWHAVMWLPLALMVYALGSMVWSHTYLGGVEAVRWFIFSVILWLGVNTFSRARLTYVAEGIHWGAVVASFWTALQFWIDFTYFPQGPNPASTFVNRNFFAEFLVCTIPFSAYLLAQARGSPRIGMMAITLGFNIVALMMTGTRGALSALWITTGVVLPVIAVLYRKQFAYFGWDSGKRILACGLLMASVVGFGLINSGNPKLLADSQLYGWGTNAFNRAFKRTVSISTDDSSLGTRFIMWKATGRLIEARPLSGVGAGAWEATLPLYQDSGSQLETDYYVHNEILQLIAEYGLTGDLVLLALFSYLLFAAWKTVSNRSSEGMSEAPIRSIALTSLLAFLIISNIGFPWRLASTDCLFALCLGLLAASDSRLQIRGFAASSRITWRPIYSQLLAVFMMFSLVLTVYISLQAATVEQKIVRAVKMSLGITQSGDVNNPKWDKTKRDILALTKEAVDINTHYRKITPMVADEFAKWGDWKNAVWIWESVAVSRPYVVAIMSNIARGYAQMGNNEKALEFLARCEKLQPTAVSVRSLKVILMSRSGKEPEAAILAKKYLDEGTYDFDLVNAAFVLSMRKLDYDTAIKSLEIRNKDWPALRVDSFLKLGGIYANRKEDAKALASYKSAVDGTAEPNKDSIRKQIPPAYLARF